MTQIKIDIGEDIQKILSKSDKKNLLTLREQVEEIIRQSAVITKSGSSTSDDKIDDTLVGVFSRSRKGRRGK